MLQYKYLYNNLFMAGNISAVYVQMLFINFVQFYV